MAVSFPGAAALGQELDWATHAGGPNADQGLSLAVDTAGNSYVVGLFVGPATFGAGETNETILPGTGSYDLFLAKYDIAGKLVWAKRADLDGSGTKMSIAVDQSGKSYVTGMFGGTTYPISGTATFGPGEPNQTVLTSAGAFGDIFIAKYDTDGALIWARRAGGTGTDWGYGIAVDGSGNSYVTGLFGLGLDAGALVATFGSGEANQTMLTSAGRYDAFVAKYDGSGGLVWAKRAGGTSDDQGFAIAVDAASNSYVTGQFAGWPGSATATFGVGELNETTLTSTSGYDMFVAKYDSVGALVWAKQAGGPNYAWGAGIAVDGTGNGYVVGAFQGTATFGPGEASESALTSAGISDMFVAKYDSSGAFVWVKRAGGVDNDFGLGVVIDATSNSYVTGSFLGIATFGPAEVNQTILTSAGASDIFVAKFDANGDLVWAKQAGGTSDFEEGVGIALDGAGNSYVAGTFGNGAQGTATFGAGDPNQTTLITSGATDIFVAKYLNASAGETPTGTDVTVTPIGGVTMTFASVSAAGTTTATVSGSGPEAPSGFNLGDPPTYYDITTTALVSGPIVTCFSAAWVTDQTQFDLLRVLHGESGLLIDRTILAPDTPAPDFATRTICARTDSLSPFVLARRTYSWSGVLQPVNGDGSSIFKKGSTVPVKFKLTGSSAAINNLQVRLYVAKVSNSVIGTELEAASGAAATTGNLFRYDSSSGQYVFNWGTSGQTAGTYQLRIDLPDGLKRTVTVSLK